MPMAVETLFLITISIKYNYTYWQPNSTHPLCPFLPLLVWTSVECCCSLSTRSTCRNPRPSCTHLHHTVMPLFYTKVCASFTCNVHNCHHQHSFLFHYSTYPCNSNLRAHCIPTKLLYNT